MKTVLTILALGEGATGLLLFVDPFLVSRLLFGTDITGAGIVMSRIAGVALVGLGISCWPGDSARQQCYGMLAYSTLVMLSLARIGIRGMSVGVLLWPAVVTHAIIVVILLVLQTRDPATPTRM